jgi:proline iminopeptidase
MRRIIALGFIIIALGLPARAGGAAKQEKAQSSNVEEGYVNGADGVRLFYRKVGKGVDYIVYLHGGPGLSINDGGYDIEPLAGNHTLIMYDQRGAGHSDIIKDPALLTATYDVRDLEALRAHFGIEKMTLIGLSWGSGLAALYAAEHPDRISRIVFLSPMPPARTPYMTQRTEKTGALITEKDRARLTQIAADYPNASDEKLKGLCEERIHILFGPYLFNVANYARTRGNECNIPAAAIRNQAAVAQATFGSLGDWDFRPGLARLKVPVLVVEGEKTYVPLDATREWAKSAPGARLLLLPGAGHLNYLERPDLFFPQVGLFLNGEWPAGAKEIK